MTQRQRIQLVAFVAVLVVVVVGVYLVMRG